MVLTPTESHSVKGRLDSPAPNLQYHGEETILFECEAPITDLILHGILCFRGACFAPCTLACTSTKIDECYCIRS